MALNGGPKDLVFSLSALAVFFTGGIMPDLQPAKEIGDFLRVVSG